MKFTTKDADYDANAGANCAVENSGGWWYASCLSCNLNGIYGSSTAYKGIFWNGVTSSTTSLSNSTMGILPIELGKVQDSDRSQACPEGTYASFTQEKCLATCQECGGGFICNTAMRQCLACPAGQFFENSTKTCVSTCPANTYGDKYPNGVCVIICTSGKVYENSTLTCEDKCKTGFRENTTYICQAICTNGYADNISRICMERCPPDSWASVLPIRICLKRCPGNATETPATAYFGENTTQTCVQKCTTGSAENDSAVCVSICFFYQFSYFNATETLYRCLKRCPTFWYGAIESSICREGCWNPTYGENETNICEPICRKKNTYIEPENRICKLCHNACALCNGPYLDQCIQCPINYVMTGVYCKYSLCPYDKYFYIPDPVANYSAGSCVSLCPGNLYGIPETKTCLDKCLKSTQFIDPVTKDCKGCHDTCLTCNGPTSTNCLSCVAPNTLISGACASKCPIPQFWDSIPGACVNKCSENSFGNNFTRNCEKSCASNVYADPNDRICKSCDPSCKTCAGIYNTNCTSCEEEVLLSSESKCISGCDYPYFLDTITKTCVPQCQIPYVGVNQSRTCKLICPNENEYVSDTRICTSCHYTCKLCTGPTPENCTECSPGLFLQNNACKAKCSAPEYSDSNTRKCLKICPEDAKLYGDNATRSCQPACTDKNVYIDLSDRICKKCHISCVTCTGPSDLQCTSCLIGEMLAKNNSCVIQCNSSEFFNNDTKNCSNPCPQGTYGIVSTRICQKTCSSIFEYPDETDRICKVCNPPCLTCTGPSDNNCTSCPLPLLYYNSRCYETCPIGTVLDRDIMNCSTKCSRRLYLDSLHSECVEKCPEGYYGEIAGEAKKCVEKCYSDDMNFFFGDNATRLCKKCHDYCLGCTGPTSNDCLKCKSSYFLDNSNNCVKKCKAGTYGFYKVKKCLLTCPEGTYGNPESWTCDQKCLSTKYYKNDGLRICSLCDPSCMSCKGPAASSCIGCSPGYYMINISSEVNPERLKQLIQMLKFGNADPENIDDEYLISCTKCDKLGYRLNIDEGICEKCSDSHCTICKNDRATCQECAEGFLLEKDYCKSLGTIKSKLFLANVNNPTDIRLQLEVAFQDYFYRFKGKNEPISIEIPTLDAKNYNATYKLLGKTNAIKIALKYNETVPEGTMVYVILADIPGSKYKHEETNLSIAIPQFLVCYGDEYYDTGIFFSIS